jgi:hypothetical protein
MRTNTGDSGVFRACPPYASVRLERLSAGLCDPDMDNLGRPSASHHSLAFCGRMARADEAGDHVAGEAVDPHKQRFGRTARADGEQIKQFQRAARLRAETPLSSDQHVSSIGRKLCTLS